MNQHPMPKESDFSQAGFPGQHFHLSSVWLRCCDSVGQSLPWHLRGLSEGFEDQQADLKFTGCGGLPEHSHID